MKQLAKVYAAETKRGKEIYSMKTSPLAIFVHADQVGMLG